MNKTLNIILSKLVQIIMKPIEELYNHITSIKAIEVLIHESELPWMIKVKNRNCGCIFDLHYNQNSDGVIIGDNVLSIDLINRRELNLPVPESWPHSPDYHKKNQKKAGRPLPPRPLGGVHTELT